MSKITIGFPACKFPDHRERVRYNARQTIAKRRSGHERPYSWSIGYGMVVGKCTGGRDHPEYSGSSLNRSLTKKHYGDQETALETENRILFRVAFMVARKIARIPQWKVWREYSNFVSCPNIENARSLVDRFRSEMGGDELSVCGGLHVLSARSRGKVKDKATAFYRACPGSRIFVTLTFIGAVDDQTGVAILNKFLTAIRAEYPGFQYLWVAERQNKNEKFPSNIHFHMICNKRLPVKRFNGLWVMQQYNAGLVGENRYGERIDKKEILDRLEKGTVGKVLNPFDVKKIYGIGGLSAYLTKYITKQDKNEIFACSAWHCSRRVSRMFTRQVVGPSAFAYACSFKNGRVDTKTGEIFEVQVIRKQFFVMVYVNNKKFPLYYLRRLEQLNKWIMQGFDLDELPMVTDDQYRKLFVCEN